MDILVLGESPRMHDQFFTNAQTARECVAILEAELAIPLQKFDVILEPSCGEGAFLKALTTISMANLIYMDIDAADSSIRKDFLTAEVLPKKYSHIAKKRPFVGPSASTRTGTCLTIGNPPFGKNASTALAFFNRAALFSDVIAFILPKTFCKNSMKDRMCREFFLLRETPLEGERFTFEGRSTAVPCVFQMWFHRDSQHILMRPIHIPADRLRPISPRLTKTDDFTFVKVGDSPDAIIRRVGVLAGRVFTTELDKWITTNHYFVRVTDRTRVSEVVKNLIDLDLENLPAKYETAGMPSINTTELCMAYNERYKKD
jgi:predicted RNA methylase